VNPHEVARAGCDRYTSTLASADSSIPHDAEPLAVAVGIATSVSAAKVRALRGSLSRANFAAKLGVTPNTVYRWELADDAAESRRPRGKQLERLLAFIQRADAPQQREPFADAPQSSSSSSAARARSSEGLAEAMPAVEKIFRGEARRGQRSLLHLLATRRSLSPNARAVASFGLAVAELVLAADAKRALLALSPALADAEEGTLEPQICARIFAAAALVRSLPDASLFDIGYVHAYAARVEALAAQSDQEALCLTLLASLSAAMLVGDKELLERAFSRIEEAGFGALPSLLELHIEEFAGLRPMLAGKATTATRSFEALAERALQAGYPILAARSFTHQAQCDLDNLVDPEGVLELVRRARDASHAARSAMGLHQMLMARAEGEALLRLGRSEESLEALSLLEVWSDETGVPPLSAIPTWMRVLHLTGRVEGFARVAQRLRDCQVPSLRPICRAYLAYLDAMEALATSADTKLMVAAFEEAEGEAKRWPFLLRQVLQHRVLAHIINWDEGLARLALRRAQRFMESYPAPWMSAHLRRIEGTLAAADGNWVEARHLIESAVHTFDLAHDQCDAGLARYMLAAFAEAYSEPGAAKELVERRQALARIGIKPPHSLQVGMERLKRHRLAERKPGRASQGLDIESLVVPLQRLSVRGALPSLILRELISIVEGLFTERRVWLEELDSSGTPREVLGGPAPPGVQATEFSDGAGRTFRISLSGQSSITERSLLSILTTASSLALEAATLRGFDERRGSPASEERPADLPGFLAAAPSMRKMRGELARLAGSSATVIITGESGVGKEVVARAVHDLSDRSTKPYVAFNCATVPRDLFEGQLFGYRRGAFTGAVSDHPGVIRAADGGTLFLDEIGELPLDIQPKLLRFLENGEIFPLGERRPIRVDVRVLAATHRNLTALVQGNRFREDLYYRLQVVPIFVPPLRDRKEDIPLLARHFLRELTRRGEPPVLAPDAVAALVSHSWPGNVRELRNVVERAMAFSPIPSVLRSEHLSLDATPLRGD
jgi:DNA-binding transcriptional regulator YiaG